MNFKSRKKSRYKIGQSVIQSIEIRKKMDHIHFTLKMAERSHTHHHKNSHFTPCRTKYMSVHGKNSIRLSRI